MHTTKRKHYAPTAPATEIVVNGAYWIAKKAPTPSGDRLVWWVRPSNAGCGATPAWRTSGYTAADRDRALAALSSKQIAEYFYG